MFWAVHHMISRSLEFLIFMSSKSYWFEKEEQHINKLTNTRSELWMTILESMRLAAYSFGKNLRPFKWCIVFVLFSGTTGDLVTNPRAYSVGCRPPSLLTGSSSSVSTTGSGSSHHHSRHKSRFIDIPGATTASGTSGTGTGSQASSFRCVSRHGQSLYWTAKSSFFSGKWPAWGWELETQITPQGWIFWTMIFYNLKRFTSRSI